jgi:6-phosphogluconolactonase (cycloisomerase 2 family)
LFYGISVDASGKISTTPGSPYTSGVSSGGPMIAVAASKNLLFVTGHSSFDTGAINIISFRSDANGRLTQLTTTAADGAQWLARDASGRHLYAAAMADPKHQGFTSPSIYGFTVDQSSGTLAPVAGSPWSLNYGGEGGELNTIAVSPDGSNVCVSIVVSRNNEAIDCYARQGDGSIDANNFQTVTRSTLPQRFTFSADSTHLLSVNADGNTVKSSPLSGSTASQEVSSGGTLPNALALHPGGHWLAVTNESSGNVSIIELGSQGSLALTAKVVPAGTGTFEISFSHSGDYLFVTAAEGTFIFSFNGDTGALVPINADHAAPGTGNVVGF